MASRKKTTQPCPKKDLFTDSYYPCASKLLSSATAQYLLEDTADDVQTAEERQAVESPNQTQKLQPSATLQEAASQEEAKSDWQSTKGRCESSCKAG
jgi:hypothetical protein